MKNTLIAVLLALAPLAAAAQDWPSKPVKFIVPFPPGGSVDPLARLAGAKLGEALKQQFIVENRPGAGGTVGTAAAAKSPADGYTFLLVFDSHAVNPALVPGLPYDTLRDFDPVMLVGTAPYAIAAATAKPFRDFAQVGVFAKTKPDAVSVGSIGNGTLGHLLIVMAQQQGNFKVTHAPYKGGGPMVQDILGGQIDMGVGSVALIAPQVRGGKLKALAVAGERRSAALPDVPTLIEQGFPGLTAYAWWGFFAPAGTPRPILARLHAELTKVFQQPDVRKNLADTFGMDLAVSTPAELQTWLEGEMQRWSRVVRENSIRPD